MNSGLDNDRRSLMDHITLLFSQYHELLTHSLEDKEHYHMEEKMYTLVFDNCNTYIHILYSLHMTFCH